MSASPRASTRRWTRARTSRRAAPPQAAARLPAADDDRDDRAPARRPAQVGELDHDLTVQHEGEPIGERITVSGRVFDTEGKPLRNTLVEIWQANAAGRYRHRWDRWPAPLDPNFSGAGRCITDDEGRYPLRHDQARALPVGQPLQRLATRPHPLLAAGAGVRAATGDPDVLPGRPALPLRPDLQLDPRPRPASG